jgi:transcriptional regulator with AAA-type ATPase domain
MWTLTPAEREAAEAVNAAAFANPFSDQRLAEDAHILRAAAALSPGTEFPSFKEALFGWVDELRRSRFDYRRFTPGVRDLMRVVFLFDIYHRHMGDLDDLIERETSSAGPPGSAPFGAMALRRLREHGFEGEEAVRFFGIFYQIRRAHFFIVRGLRGSAPCMKEFRRRLWNNVFTADVRCYDQFLWDRMEDFSTLLLGETGTGKGTAAAAIGRSGYIPFRESRGSFVESFTQNFVSANLAQYPETLLEAELFGYRKGAFTGAVDSYQGLLGRCSPHGAVFLDELGEVGAPIQVKLLQILQERTFCPVGSRDPLRFQGRVIAATNKTLAELRSKKLFRDDFFYRISSDIIVVPSLRERLREDPAELDLLLEAILSRMTGGRSPNLLDHISVTLKKTLPPDYPWPGNVRELEQAVRRILLTGSYNPEPAAPVGDALAQEFRALTLTADQLLARYSRAALEQLGTRAEVARRLELDPRTIDRYLKLYSAAA